MADPVSDTLAGADSRAWFAATHWSIVLAAETAEPEQRAAALESLCRIYWEPLYAFVRRLGHPAPDAQDLVQGFFAHLLSRDWLAGVSPAKGKFRSFLLAALKNFLANERTRANACKRGGGVEVIPIDQAVAEAHLALAGPEAGSAEAHFDRQWALTLMKRAHERLREESVASGRASQFDRLSVFLTREGKGEEYATLGDSLHLTAGAVSVAVCRLRQRYREHLRAEVAQTVSAPDELAAEMRYLLEVLCQ